MGEAPEKGLTVPPAGKCLCQQGTTNQREKGSPPAPGAAEKPPRTDGGPQRLESSARIQRRGGVGQVKETSPLYNLKQFGGAPDYARFSNPRLKKEKTTSCPGLHGNATKGVRE